MKALFVCVLLELLLLSVCASENCTSNGFIDTLDSTVEGLVGIVGPQVPLQFIFPTFNFSCEGTITGWTFVGTKHGGNIGNVIFPTLQVWRQVGSTFNLIGSSDGSITATSVSHTFPSGAMIYTLTVEPIAVQPGDMLGVLFTANESYNGTLIPHYDLGVDDHDNITFFTILLNSEVTSIDESDLNVLAGDFTLLITPSIGPTTSTLPFPTSRTTAIASMATTTCTTNTCTCNSNMILLVVVPSVSALVVVISCTITIALLAILMKVKQALKKYNKSIGDNKSSNCNEDYVDMSGNNPLDTRYNPSYQVSSSWIDNAEAETYESISAGSEYLYS